MMRIHKSMLASPMTLLIVLAAGAAPAGAASGYSNVCPTLKTTFCSTGALAEIGDLAIDNSSGSSAGDVWVISDGRSADGITSKLLKLDASGSLLAEVGEEALPSSAQPISGGSHFLDQVAVDPAGDIFVSDLETNSGTGSVTKFNSAGIFQFQLAAGSCVPAISGCETPESTFYPGALAIDPASDDLYVEDQASGTVDKFTSDGKYIEQFQVYRGTGLSLNSIAADSSGHIYVANRTLGQSGTSGSGSQVREYSATGTPVDCPDGSNIVYEVPPVAQSSEVAGPLAVDPSDDHLFIGEQSASEGLAIVEYGAPCAAPTVAFGGGEFVREFGFGRAAGIGVSSSTHEVYATDGVGLVGLVFAKVTIPDVTTAASASAITRTSAVVSGTVNPDGTSVTSCEFEYGTSVVYGRSVPCAQTLPLSGNGPVTVSAEIEGLALPPATIVHYRLKATSNAPNVGADETFTTEPFAAPVLTGSPASGVTQFAATLNATIDTGGALVGYHFEYGTSTAYGQLAPIPDSDTPVGGGEAVAVSQSVTGLRPGTTYHYRLVASSPGGTGVLGPDQTLTTLPVPVALVSAELASAVGSGEALLSGTIDPRGWSTGYRFEYGTTADYGSNWPTVDVDLGAFTGAQPVSVLLPNLQPGTTYHYRLVASNGGGSSYGPDMTFTTAAYPVSAIAQAPLLAGLPIAFPAEAGATGGARAKPLSNARKLARALKACARKPRRQRAACARQARRRYGPVVRQKRKR